ncbi:MAG: 30S ribosomal protein S12 methylthiotransferase RimO [Coriobacteriales bacterium]|jgi:ribosomal protein S12 methylthiotransferase|nr:30S ribosomal protein S12 methylthiotransferase RimO [Coriobacteriales bacterium]
MTQPFQYTFPEYSISFVTLGCAKNEVDSDKMRARVRAAGFIESEDPADADVVVVNTCSFITEATEESLATILEVLALPRLLEGAAKLVVTGCMPARYGAELAAGLPEVAAFVSCAEEERIVEVIGELFDRAGADDDVDDVGVAGAAGAAGSADGAAGNAPDPAPAFAASTLLAVPSRTISAPWAYVKIADGCDRCCSFCTIPRIRGRYRSVPAREIIAEVAELVGGGVREVVLIAQDTGLWHDEGDVCNLPKLLEALAARFPTTWLRVMYLQPQGITDELLAVMGRHANICNYLDIPLQHASARVLGDMNREGSGAAWLALLARIRAALPDVALRTTVIAGFPGETRSEARELERFIEQAAFDYVGVFAYSQEDGTVAGRREDQVPLRTRKARAQRLRDVADVSGFAKVAARVGMSEQVLVVGTDEDEWDGSHPVLGRTQRQAPEVDGMVHLEQGNSGELVFATMTEAYCYELDGKVEDTHD